MISIIYREPRLGPIALCTAISFVLWGVSNQHLALLRRTMQFGTIARIQFLSTFVGIAVAISMASCGYGYWALVLRPIAMALCVAFGAWSLCRWRPGLPAFDDGEVKSMVRFGLHVTRFSVVYSLAKQWIGSGWACSTGLMSSAIIKTQQCSMSTQSYSHSPRCTQSEAHRSASFNLILLISGRNTNRRCLR